MAVRSMKVLYIRGLSDDEFRQATIGEAIKNAMPDYGIIEASEMQEAKELIVSNCDTSLVFIDAGSFPEWNEFISFTKCIPRLRHLRFVVLSDNKALMHDSLNSEEFLKTFGLNGPSAKSPDTRDPVPDYVMTRCGLTPRKVGEVLHSLDMYRALPSRDVFHGGAD